MLNEGLETTWLRERGNTMRVRISRATTLVAVCALSFALTSAAHASEENDTAVKPAYDDERNPPSQEPNYQGKSLAYWLTVIRNRNEEMMPLAFEAIRNLGPEARAAVPELTRIVAAPFTPIRLGKEPDETIARKLYDLDVRSDAVDALAAIGEAASSATVPLIEWALTMRIIPAPTNSPEEHERFVDLVTLEAAYRLSVATAVQQFGHAAFPGVAKFLRSADVENRRLAVIILGTDVLPIAAHLLKSRDCDDVRLGITILGDLEPVVPKAYLTRLDAMGVCYAN